MVDSEDGDGKTGRFHMRVSPDEVSAIDDWRFANRVGSRSDAVRRLCAMGIIASAGLREISVAADAVLNTAEHQLYEPTPERLLDQMRELFELIEIQSAQLAAYHREGSFTERQASAAAGKKAAQDAAQKAADWRQHMEAALRAIIPSKGEDDA